MTSYDAQSEEMERLLRYLGACDPLELDTGTADRLLDGAMDSDDAPRAYAPVATAFATLRAAPTAAELSGEAQAVSRIAQVIAADTIAYHESHRARSRRVRRTRSRRRAATLALAAVIGVGLFGGLAAANALPRGAQSVAAQVLDTVGLSVPDPDAGTGGGVPPLPVGPAAPNLNFSGDTSSTPGGGHGNGNANGHANATANAGGGSGNAYGHDNATANAGGGNANAGNGNAYGRDNPKADAGGGNGTGGNGGNGGNAADSTGNPDHGNGGGGAP
jgi:hypothetical protein